MPLLGSTSKLLNGIDKNGELIGAGIEAWKRKDLLMSEVQKIVDGHIHMPNLNNVVGNLKVTPSFTQGLGAYIGGQILKWADLHPMLNKAGSIVSKVGGGVALVTVIENVLGYATNPGYPPGQGNSSVSIGAINQEMMVIQ